MIAGDDECDLTVTTSWFQLLIISILLPIFNTAITISTTIFSFSYVAILLDYIYRPDPPNHITYSLSTHHFSLAHTSANTYQCLQNWCIFEHTALIQGDLALPRMLAIKTLECHLPVSPPMLCGSALTFA